MKHVEQCLTYSTCSTNINFIVITWGREHIRPDASNTDGFMSSGQVGQCLPTLLLVHEHPPKVLCAIGKSDIPSWRRGTRTRGNSRQLSMSMWRRRCGHQLCMRAIISAHYSKRCDVSILLLQSCMASIVFPKTSQGPN